MFIRYKKAHEKIAMGLLSFMPEERDVKRLCETIQRYESDPSRRLLLYRMKGDIVGLVGVEIGERAARVLHLSVSPAHRDEGVATAIVRALPEQLGVDDLLPSEATQSFFDRYTKTGVQGNR